MITNDGKEIISKFLLGQVPSYATHLSIGCGAVPLALDENLPVNLHAKQMMDFEMTRVPISSKGFTDDSKTYSISFKAVDSNVVTLTTSTAHDIVAGETVIISGVDSILDGQYRVTGTNYPTNTTFSYSLVTVDILSPLPVSPVGSVIVSRTKISLTAEIPSDNRYEITEVAIWSAGSNSLASQYESRVMFNFTQSWQKHFGVAGAGSTIESIPLNTNLGYDSETKLTGVDIKEPSNLFFAETNDPIFQTTDRKDRKEGPRHLNRTLMAKGNLSVINMPDGLDGNWVVDPENATHAQLDNINFDISGNNTADILKLAFSLVDKTSIDMAPVSDIKILIEFYKTRVNTTSGYAKAQIYIPGSYFATDRYNVSSWEISQSIDYSNEAASLSLPYTRFFTSADFSSSEVRLCRIFVDVTETSEEDGSHYIAFDGFRIENTTENPVYKMSGYSVIKYDGYPIIKSANTNNYVDFRFSLGVS